MSPAKTPAPPGLADEYRAGASTAELAEKYGTSPPTIARMLEDLGVSRRPAEARNYADAKIPFPPNLAKDYAAGMSAAKLATMHGVSAPTIGRMLDELGVEKRKIKRDGKVPEGFAEDYKNGVTYKELIAKYGYGAPTIRRMANELKLKHRRVN